MQLLLKPVALGLLSAGLLLVAPALRAQDLPAMEWIGPEIESQRFNTLLRGSLTIEANSAARLTALAKAASLPYAPTPALKRETVQGYVARLKPKSPTAAQAVATNFGSGKYDYSTIYNGLVSGYNLRENDAVDALAAYLVLGYRIVNNISDNKLVSPAMVQGVQAQFGPRLARNPKLMPPGVAAQFGEEMKLQCVVLQGGWQAAIKENRLPAYRQSVAALFKTQWGFDVSQLRLTKLGFSKR